MTQQEILEQVKRAIASTLEWAGDGDAVSGCFSKLREALALLNQMPEHMAEVQREELVEEIVQAIRDADNGENNIHDIAKAALAIAERKLLGGV